MSIHAALLLLSASPALPQTAQQAPPLRCGSDFGPPPPAEARPSSDCELGSTTILPEYEPQGHPLYRIPCVVHIIEHSNGQGRISNALVASQIDVLNEDFRALAGSLGENGTDARVEFYLATEDPDGSPTNGITRTVNDTWYLDSGDYWTPLGWDTTRYLNFYTNNASGFLGYVPGLPQGGVVGQTWDRVIVLWSAFGRNAPIGPPYDLGRTATHEVGHYFGLYHTFQGGCAGTSGCYQNGDLICDTNPEGSPVFGCPGSSQSCGLPDPFDNYMDYSDDSCYERFTPEQINRMRCTLENWRVDLADPPTTCTTATAVVRNAGSNPLAYTASPPVLGQNMTLDVIDFTYTTAAVVVRTAPTTLTLNGGQTVLVEPSSSVLFKRFLTLPFGSTEVAVPNDMALCGITGYSQAVLFGGAPSFLLTNAVDLTPGL